MPATSKKNFLILCFLVLSVLQSLAQAPAITSFSPTSGPVGTSVNITGINFSAISGNNTVYFGAVKATVTAATNTTLTVTVPAGSTYQLFTVTTNHLTAWSPQPFVTTFSGGGSPFTPGSFAFETDITTNLHPYAAAIIDLDGDGIPDLATPNNANSPSSLISVVRNTSSGGVMSFDPKLDFPAPPGSLPNSMAAADIDGDGLPDLVVTNNVSNTVSVYRNTSTPGTISLAARVEFATGEAPWTVAVGDLDGDGKPDLAVTNFMSNTVSVLRNMGTTGTIAFAAKSDLVSGLSPNTVAIGDLDGDGKPDLAVTNALSSTVSLFKNQSSSGAIVFAPKTDIATGTDEPGAIAIGDLDGDDKPDLTMTNYNFNLTTAAAVSMSVWKNTGSPGSLSFSSKINYGSGDVHNVSLGDLNGDGKLEVIVANSISGVFVYQNISTPGNIVLANPMTYYANSAYSFGMSDLDGDNMPDLAVANFTSETVSILKNKVTYPAIVSFSPTSALTGTTVTINGANFTGATAVNFGGIPATSFVVVSSTSITAVVGAGASGDVSVTTPKGIATVAGFTYLVPPAVTSFAPDSGGTGAAIAIKGANLTGASAVNFGGVPVSSFIVTSDTTITAIVGAGASGNVGVTTAGGQSVLPGFHYTGPSISSVTPSSGTSGNIINITGNNFTGATAVSFGGVAAASFTVQSPTTITAILATGAPGDVSVTTSNGVAILPGFAYTGPMISSFAPVAGNTGTVITIRGLNFTGTTSVRFGGIPAASFSLISPTVITAVVGSGTSGMIEIATPIGTVYLDGFTFSTTLPIIAAVNPSVGKVGDVITITGSNFSSTASDNIVYFGAVRATVSAATATSLTVAVPAGATYSPVSVTTNNLTAYDSRPFMPTFAGGGAGFTPDAFSARLDFSTSDRDQAVALSDVDGDGKPDIITANLNGWVSVFPNNGNNGRISFAPKTDYITGSSQTNSITVGDLDGDGKPELIAEGTNPDNVSIFLNKSIPGNISFDVPTTLAVGHGPWNASIGDLDGDGKPDLVVADIYSNFLTIFRNTSTPGNLSFGPGIDFMTGQYPAQVAIIDLDGDGKRDLVVANTGSSSTPSNTISVLKNTTIGSNISFENKMDFQAGINPRVVAAGDLDGDGKPDLAVANRGNSYVTVFRNTGTAGTISFASKVEYATGITPADVAVGDLDGDGKPDLAVANAYSGSISVYKNVSAPGIVSFDTNIDYGNTLYGPSGIAIGDLDGDGKPDLTATNSGAGYISVLKNKVNDPSPIISAGGDTIFCSGSFVVLNSSTTANQWYKDGVRMNGATDIMLQVTTSGTYTATALVGGVESAPSNAITVKVNTTPSKPVIASDAIKGLVSSSSTGNLWYDNNFNAIPGANGQNYKPTIDGGYYLKVSQNGCSSAFSDRYDYVSIIDLGGVGTLRVAPNPIGNFMVLTLNYPGVNSFRAELSDMNGRVQLTYGSLHSGERLNTSGLAAGIYFLKVYTNDGKINVTTTVVKL